MGLFSDHAALPGEVGCHFYLRHEIPTGIRYTGLVVRGPMGQSCLRTLHPPVVGDLIHLNLNAHQQHHGFLFRVVAREWSYSSWGSYNWPLGEPRQMVPVGLDVIVEAAVGLFADEAPLTPEEEEEG